MPRLRHDQKIIETHQWNDSVKRNKKHFKVTVSHTFPRKEVYYKEFDKFRVVALRFLDLTDGIELLNKDRDWVYELFGLLINADEIINNYEYGKTDYISKKIIK